MPRYRVEVEICMKNTEIFYLDAESVEVACQKADEMAGDFDVESVEGWLEGAEVESTYGVSAHECEKVT